MHTIKHNFCKLLDFIQLKFESRMPSLKYNEPAFWEEKYKTTCCEAYQWICKPEHIFSSSVADHLKYQQMEKVLQIGCGTSAFSLKLRREVEGRNGKIDITCVDFSKELVKKYRKTEPSVNYVCADVRSMSDVPSQQFDYIFDKGCLDCLLCCDSFIKQVIKGLRECYRVLKPSGKLIVITHGKPKNRAYLFRNKLVPFGLKVEKLAKTKDRPTEVYAYICTKGEQNQTEQHGEEEGKIIIPEQQPKKQVKKEEKKKQENNFVLEQPKKKKIEGGNFILAQDHHKKPAKNEKEPPGQFILDEPQNQPQQEQQQAQEIENQTNQQQEKQEQGHEQEEKENQQQQGEQQKEPTGQQEKQEQKGKQQQSNFILKQAQYQNDFQQV